MKTKTIQAKDTQYEPANIKQSLESSDDSKCNTTTVLSAVPDLSHLKVGDKVKISGVKTGVVRFYGRTHFADGDWCGIELDEPEGRHDGLIEGTRYFQCKPKHGLFAPIHKVEVFTEDLYMYDSEAVYALSDISSCDERSPSPEDSADQLMKAAPGKSIQSEHTFGYSCDQYQENRLVKGQSRLIQKKSFHSKDVESTDSTSSSRESSASRESDLGRVRKAEKRSATDISKSPETFVRMCSPHEKKTKMSNNTQVPDLNVTFVKDTVNEDNDDLLNVCKSSRVDDRTAHTLAYGLESVGTDAEVQKNLNGTFAILKDDQSTNLSEIQQGVICEKDVSDLDDGDQLQQHMDTWSPEVLSRRSFVKQPSLEWDPEEEGDTLGMSVVSMTSSLGILSDSQIMSRSLFGEDFSTHISREAKHQDGGLIIKQKHTIPEMIEAELDKEIAGIATPEIDMSSSTVSGKEDGSSPEPDQTTSFKKELDLPIALPDVKKSKPPLMAQKSAGEKLATPSTEEITIKDYGEKFQDVNEGKDYSCVGDSYEENNREIEELNLKEHRLSASFELAKTAVEQYASLVKGAEEEKTVQVEKIRSLKTQDVMILSLKGKFMGLADDNTKGLIDITFPDDLITSYVQDAGRSLDHSPDDVYFDIENPLENDLKYNQQDAGTSKDETYSYPVKQNDSVILEQKDRDKAMHSSRDMNILEADVSFDDQNKCNQTFLLSQTKDINSKTYSLTSDIERQQIFSKILDGDEVDHSSGDPDLSDDECIEEQITKLMGSPCQEHVGTDNVTPTAAHHIRPDYRKQISVEVDDDFKENKGLGDDVNVQNYSETTDSHEDQTLFDEGQQTAVNTTDNLIKAREDNDCKDRNDIIVNDDVISQTDVSCNRSDDEQLMADLEAGHSRVERPISLVSSCSADTGIVVDYRDGNKERPFSMISTSSADTG
ncbi:hypothetical protein LSH36_402g03045 [Paralvinella palmiformis]|uniref:CAP-Gly domain-containing protein n=1 Tax=Paralvinella palmiformis TaxID=53620 RepID=A0AAD9N0H4_9ANNE|nr:hypothetical protein LSH36_402g03045 [Paralvinella palmiformis]